ncbi:MAG: ABC transporter permease [Pleomorphochaeta sp.]
MKKYFKNKNFLTGFIFLSFILIVILLGMIKLPFEINNIDISNKLLSSSKEHLLGTDHLGRDILSRIMVGARLSVEIGFYVVLLGFIIGTPIGAIAGYYSKYIDEIIKKVIDTLMSFPGVLIALMIIAVFGVSTKNIIIALTIMSIPRFARIARGGYYSYKNSPFVLATKARGASNFRIMVIHIFNHIYGEIIVTASLTFASAVLSEAGLSYLGLGIQPPNPSLGKMVSEAQGYILQKPSYVIIPSIFIIILVMGFNLLGDGINKVIEENKENE